MSSFDFTINGYQILHLVNETGNLSYFRALREADGKTVIIKIIKPDPFSAEEQNHFKMEYKILSMLNNVDGVIKTYGMEIFQDFFAMIFEDLGVRSLKLAMNDRKKAGQGFLPVDKFLQLAVRITQILANIHSLNVIHKDINPENIFYNQTTDQLRIGGFHISTNLLKEYPVMQNTGRIEGNPEYISPEQTGRINRVVDSRSDLYSLGATFYELLTGHSPFESSDLLALVHAHIARIPQPVSVKNPEVPGVLSDIIMKLLAKNAEDRYQSAYGLAADLERCQSGLADKHMASSSGLPGAANSFNLGQDDFSGKLQIPQKLYGLDREYEELLSTFQRTAEGSREILLISGPTGTGMSTLAAELRNPVLEKRGFFINGNFEKNQQDIPYTGFIRAFNQLVELILIEPEGELKIWRKKILSALDGNGTVLMELIPNLEKIIGTQPAIPEINGQLSRNRFKLTLQNFIQIIGSSLHPLVLFVDDLQWADMASLELIKMLMAGEKITHLLIIGAYRKPVPGETAPCLKTFHEITAAGIPMQTIALKNLQPDEVLRMIQDTLTCPLDEILEFGEFVFEKTQGNPFLVRQFLQNLFENCWLNFNYPARRWTWDIVQIKAQQFSDNAGSLMADKIGKLTSETSKLLQLAACIGNEFDIKTLSHIININESEIVNQLLEAITENLLIPLDDYYRFPETAARSRFRFLHDRIQQASFSKIPIHEQQKIHLKIARFLLEQNPASELDQNIFDIVQHYNQAIAAITETGEKQQVANLNIRAADMAYMSAAFSSSQSFLEKALALMPDDAWTKQYDSMLNIHSQLAYMLSLTDDFEQLELILSITEKKARTIADTALVKHAKIRAMLARGAHTEAVDLGMAFINDLGFPIKWNPTTPYPEDSINYLRETADWVSEERIKSLYDLPEASPETAWIFETFQLIYGSVFTTDINLSFFISSQVIKLCFERGLAPKAPLLIAIFALNISSALHDIPKARLIIDTAVQLLNLKYSSYNLTHQLSISIGGFLIHQYEHLKNTLPVLSEGSKLSLTAGMFQISSDCAWWHAWHNLFLGTPLEDVEKDSLQAIEISEKVQMKRSVFCSLSVYQASLNLQNKSRIPWILKGDRYDEDQMISMALDTRDFGETVRIFFYKAWLRYMFRQPDAAEMFRKAEAYLLYGTGMYVVPLFYFYDTLANAAEFSRKSDNKARILERINRNLKEIEVWAHYAPMNHRHKKDLMEAEKARLEGRDDDAALFYEKAIRGARANEFLNEEALALELTAEFHLPRGLDEISHLYMSKAYDCYSRWQAWAKVRDLEQKYSHLLDKITIPAKKSIIETSEKGSIFDIRSVIKASQIISGRIIMEDLLGKLMEIVIENAGARHGCIILEKDERWFIETESYADNIPSPVFQSVDIDKSNSVCSAIIRYVARSRESIVLDDAAKEGIFADDPYIKSNQSKSILCAPLLNRGKLAGIFYLENNLAANAFTPDRIEILELLTGQAAIALENAVLFQKAQQEIAERKAAEAALKESEERFKTIFDSVNDAIFVHDPVSGEIVDVNAKMCSMYGYTREEALKIQTGEINSNEPPFTEKEGLEHIRKTVETGSQLFEWKAKDKHGNKFWTEVNMKLASINGQDRILVVARDISERKRFEEELAKHRDHLEELVLERTKELQSAQEELLRKERLSALGQLTATVSHELRNPLGVIRSSAFYLKEKVKDTDEKVRKHLDRIEYQVDLCNWIVEELLEYTRGSSLDMRKEDIPSWLDSTLEDIQETANIEIIKQLPADLPKFSFDRTKMSRVITNLVMNATHAVRDKMEKETGKKILHKPEIRISARLAKGPKNTDGVEISVEDNGIGMDETTRKKAFEPLFTTKARGTGLGLSIVKKIMEEHGGTIGIKSKINKGTKVILWMPDGKKSIDD